MLSDNIKKYRKANNMSQDELAEKLNVSRQSVSLWETGQSQPTLDNIVALARIFNVSSDELLGNVTGAREKTDLQGDNTENKNGNPKKIIIILSAIIVALVIALIVVLCTARNRSSVEQVSSEEATESAELPVSVEFQESTEPEEPSASTVGQSVAETEENTISETKADDSETQSAIPLEQNKDFDLFSFCKEFAIQKGELNGDYCIYQQPSTLYGGYENEYFSISYWGDSDMVEFCLHCPLDDTLSVNFYLRMRGGYDGTYEYCSSKYYRSDGTSVRTATGNIDPAVFSDKYPLSCDYYDGNTDGQNEFMEESRVGICDLIKCLKEFVTAENMECDFKDFGFVNF